MSVVSQLDDLGLALLVCLVGEQHCIIRAPEHLMENVEARLGSLASKVFSLDYATVGCDSESSGHDFVTAFELREGGPAQNDAPRGKIIVARDLDQAQPRVQIEALELMRISRGNGEHSQGQQQGTVIFIALLESNSPGPPFMVDHLNDHFFMLHDVSEHTHMPAHTQHSRPSFTTADSFASLSSLSSVIIKRDNPTSNETGITYTPQAVISPAMVANLQAHANKIRSSAEVRRYIHNIVTFLRLHRGVAGGVSALAARNLPILARILSVLHSLNYIPPSLVALATRKVFTHRIVVATPETERSMQWGSDYSAVSAALAGMTPEQIVEEVLASVECPL